jgi:hypothetical protein
MLGSAQLGAEDLRQCMLDVLKAAIAALSERADAARAQVEAVRPAPAHLRLGSPAVQLCARPAAAHCVPAHTHAAGSAEGGSAACGCLLWRGWRARLGRRLCSSRS